AKMAMSLDADLFAHLEQLAQGLKPADADQLAPIVARSIELKAEIVERDERESGDRMLLNYGHTVGHALEAGAGYGTLLHGEAVAVWMHAATITAARLDMLDGSQGRRQAELPRKLVLPASRPARADDAL